MIINSSITHMKSLILFLYQSTSCSQKVLEELYFVECHFFSFQQFRGKELYQI